jgi:ABC-type uncharacterized transport system permease subunit
MYGEKNVMLVTIFGFVFWKNTFGFKLKIIVSKKNYSNTFTN